MCIRDRFIIGTLSLAGVPLFAGFASKEEVLGATLAGGFMAVSYTHLRAHETVLDLVCRLLLEKKKYHTYKHSTFLLP